MPLKLVSLLSDVLYQCTLQKWWQNWSTNNIVCCLSFIKIFSICLLLKPEASFKSWEATGRLADLV